jgi:hypothetical protein
MLIRFKSRLLLVHEKKKKIINPEKEIYNILWKQE